MTFMAKYWDNFVTAFMKPFVRAKENRLKLLHSIESDRVAIQQRHLETVLESQHELVRHMNENVKETTSVIREWLDGFHKIGHANPSAPPVNDDERMWKLEMQELARQRGKQLTEDMSPYEMEAVIRQGFNDL
jgi:hypothetical protein